MNRKYLFDEIYQSVFMRGSRNRGYRIVEIRRCRTDRRPAGERHGAAGWLVLVRGPALANGLPVHLRVRVRYRDGAMQFQSARRGSRRSTSTYHLGVDGISMPLIAADRARDRAGGDRRLGSDRLAPGPVPGRVPDHGRPDDRRVRGARRAAVLRLLGSDADPDVPHHRRLGRPAARLRDRQVLPVHLPRLGVHAGRADLHVPQGPAATSIADHAGCR
jgi:hypothetical protein